ncbi:MAG: FecR domain-containing protein [Bdellovibrionaceae bacterium]|nr:FecR domain-containing protein [Pseudobdellovibrionaceae bacterium]
MKQAKRNCMSLKRLGILICLLTFASPSHGKDMYGTFMIVKGQVHVEHDGKKGEAKVNMKVYPGDTITSGPVSRAKITMSDRNILHISPSSVVKIASYENSESKKNVELELSQGKLRSEVIQSYKDKDKYIIKTPTAVAGVRGTDFLVSHDIKNNFTEVFTFRGSVEFSALQKDSTLGAPIILKQNEMSSAQPNQDPAPPQAVPQENMRQIRNDSSAQAPSTSSPSSGTPLNGNSSQSTNGTQPRSRIGNTADTAPSSFDKLPQNPQGAGPMAPPPPISNILPKQPDTRTNDAIRNKTDKTNVTIKPE